MSELTAIPEHDTRPDFFSREVERVRTFHFDEPACLDGLTVICGGREHCTGDYCIDRVNFPYLCIEYVESGKGLLALGGQKYELYAGTLFLYGPGIPHRITTNPEDRLVKCFVDFEGPQAMQLLEQNRLAAPGFYPLPIGSGVSKIFDRLIEAGADPRPQSPRLCRLLLECLVLQIASRLGESDTEQGRSYHTYLRCREYILGHVRKLRRMDEVAAACNVDPAHLSRLFRRFAGEGSHQFMMRHKMSTAALVLVRRGALIKQIAEEFGFEDPYHFSRAFKKVYGVSPDDYRRNALLYQAAGK